MKIGILDSGVRTDHPAFSGIEINGCHLCYDEVKGVHTENDFSDACGHGTAVFYLIDKLTDSAQIYNFKIFNNNLEVDQDIFENYLEYVYENYYFDFINLSLGIVNVESTARLKEICYKFYKKGSIIVSAFDNDGALSFPAALDYVIGVDGLEFGKGKGKQRNTDITFIKNSIVNAHCKAAMYKVAWTNPDYNYVVGNSFTCGVVTAKLANQSMRETDEGKSFFMFNNEQAITDIKDQSLQKLHFQIERAAIFPLNKEMHSLVRYPELLTFEITNIYTSRITGLVGRKVSDIIKSEDSLSMVVENIDHIDWSNFDTLILGHLEELIDLISKDIRLEILRQAVAHGKKIYSFDSLEQYNEFLNNDSIFVPRVDQKNVPANRLGKLYKTSKPVLLVAGTSSSQGKFTFQLYLRKKLLEAGYKIGQLGTEPSALLFGMDYVFPSGYNSNVHLTLQDYFSVINEMIYQMADNSVDIIIAGSQSGVIPYNDSNINFYPLMHQIYLQAIQPDAVVICINCFDEVSFVKRTVQAIEGLTGAKVVGALCFPVEYKNNWVGKLGGREKINNEREEQIRKKYKDELEMDVFFLGNEVDMDILICKCVDYFAQSNE